MVLCGQGGLELHDYVSPLAAFQLLEFRRKLVIAGGRHRGQCEHN
jgi:hypothetical protein